MDEARAGLLAEALRARLAEVRGRGADASGGADSLAGGAAGEGDPEEVLRVTMVRLFPRVRDGRATPEELRDYLLGLNALSAPARGEDLRFLDAWNNAYESLAGRRWSEAERTALLGPFLAAYASHLEAQLRRLDASDAARPGPR